MHDLAAYLDRANEIAAGFFAGTTLASWVGSQREAMTRAVQRHGHSAGWEAALAAMPAVADAELVAGAKIELSAPTPLAGSELTSLEDALRQLLPWRKGPFCLFDIDIDAEWRSDMKWARIAPALNDFRGARVLDIGCGNGYYAWRMLAAGAAVVLGLDPGVLQVAQFRAVQRYCPSLPVVVLPLAGEALAADCGSFDYVFSMGVLYHRREPLRHLAEARSALAGGGRLVLETLVVDAAGESLLEPVGRYAQMRNVHALPSPALVLRWLKSAGFTAARCVDVTATTTAEQRKTSWMPFHSLADFLDPADNTLTVEGLPAPRRGTFIARAA